MRSGHLLSSALILSLFLLPAWGDVPDPPPLGACYMGYGKTLESAQSRQLTLNAHVTSFQYQPGGLEIAYSGVQKDGEEVTQSVRLVGTRRGTATTLASTTLHISSTSEAAETDMTPYNLAGWSGDGRYLLIGQEHYVKIPETDDGYFDVSFVCADVGADPIHLVTVDLPDVGQAPKGGHTGYPYYFWSPDRTHVAFTRRDLVKGSINSAFGEVYDPKAGKLQDVAVGEDQVIRGWIDSTHLLLDDSPLLGEFSPSGKVHYASYDTTTGTQTAVPTPKVMPAAADDADNAGSVLSPKADYLRLEDEPHHIQDQQKVGAVDAHALWVRRTQGPKSQSAAPVGLTPGKDDPQAVWSPTGTQIAFIAHSDLFVTDLTMRDATALEKYAAGEKLTCPEERDLATSDLKQVGLGILQYTQDYDEKYPPGDQWQDRVNPYLKDTSLFSVAGHPVVYHAPTDLSLAKLDAPADTIIATIDLPCAVIALLADGHVRSFANQAAVKDWVAIQANAQQSRLY